MLFCGLLLVAVLGAVDQDDDRVPSSLSDDPNLNDFFNLSTNLVWNLLSDDCEALFGGDDDVEEFLLGDCCKDALHELRECCFIVIGTDR